MERCGAERGSRRALAGILWSLLAIAAPARAELLINEIYFDPPGGETPREYIEFRGTPGMSLSNYWFLIVENEDTLEKDGETGIIDQAINLSSFSLGSNGFLALRRAGGPYALAPGANEAALPDLLMENSGGTFMIIRNDGGIVPTIGLDLDDNSVNDNDNDPLTLNDGLDFATGQPNWSIVDSIGIFSERGEAGLGRTYSPITFGPERDGDTIPVLQGGPIFDASQHVEPDTQYIGTGFEIEIIARYGNSTSSGPHDWHTTNVTDNINSGYTNTGDFRQAGSDPHGFPRPAGDPATLVFESESNQYVPYGTAITTTLGGPNYPLNQASLPWDFNQDGTVNAADYTLWRDLLGAADPTGKSLIVNADRDSNVDQTDYDAWKWHFGESLPTMMGAGAAATVPEPGSWLLVAFGVTTISAWARRRQTS